MLGQWKEVFLISLHAQAYGYVSIKSLRDLAVCAIRLSLSKLMRKRKFGNT